MALGPRIGFEHVLPVHRLRQRAAYPDVLEWLAIELHHRDAAEEHGEVLSLEVRSASLGHVEIETPPALPVLGSEVVLAGDPGGESRGWILVDGDLDAVRIREPGQKVVRIPDE